MAAVARARGRCGRLHRRAEGRPASPGGYAQQAYGFNYYGTVGCNRDEFVVVRKMAKVDWLDGPNGNDLPQPLPQDI